MDHARSRFAAVVLVAALMYLLFFHQLAGRDLWGSHEARAAQDAGSIHYRNDWVLPRLTDERPELQKPPMYYWLVAAIAKLRGEVDAWAVRLPAALSATLCVAIVALTLWRRGRPVAAIGAAVLLITAQHFTWLARTARIDMPLALCVTIAVLTIGMHRRWVIFGFIAIGAGILLKGPIGAVLPLAVIVADRLLHYRLGAHVEHPLPPALRGERVAVGVPARFIAIPVGPAACARDRRAVVHSGECTNERGFLPRLLLAP